MSPKIFILSVLVIVVCHSRGMLSQKSSPDKGFSYIGCFKDTRRRALPKSFGKVPRVATCVEKCRGLKLKYAGLQYGGYCFCGNKYDRYGKATKCNKLCPSRENCGGGWSNAVYKVEHQKPKKVDLRIPTIKYVGCFDTHFIGPTAGDVISIRHCIHKCRAKGNKYAGIMSSKYCSCTDDYSKHRKATSCNKKCRSKEDRCGGRRSYSIYEVPKFPDGYIMKGYRGCYKEDPKNKVMTLYSKRRVLSAQRCARVCTYRKMKYAGMRDGKFCNCGNEYAKHGKATDCNKKCQSGEACGGVSSYSVFDTIGKLELPVRVGCYKEEKTRMLSKHKKRVSYPKKCFRKCLEYKYFGIEDGNQCYCGNDLPKRKSPGGCKRKCRSGDVCGGPKALSVFKVVLDLPPT